MDIKDLNKGDFVKKNGSAIELEVVEVGNDWRSKHDYVKIYNDVTNQTQTLIDVSEFKRTKKVKRKIFDTTSQENLIECDNPKCNYTVPNPIKDIHTDCREYIDRPCPECGWNLLTQQDYDNYDRMVRAMDWINKWFSWIMFFFPNAKYKQATIHATDGKIKTRAIDPPEDKISAELMYGDEHYECGDR